jgi:hypothetical protein
MKIIIITVITITILITITITIIITTTTPIIFIFTIQNKFKGFFYSNNIIFFKIINNYINNNEYNNTYNINNNIKHVLSKFKWFDKYVESMLVGSDKYVRFNRPTLVGFDKHVRSIFFSLLFFLSIPLKNDF